MIQNCVRLLALLLVLSPVAAATEISLHHFLDADGSRTVVQYSLYSENEGYYLPKQELWFTVPEFFTVLDVNDGYRTLQHSLDGDRLRFTTRRDVNYGEIYRINITFLPGRPNPVLYGDRAYFYDPFAWLSSDYALDYPDDWELVDVLRGNSSRLFIFRIPFTPFTNYTSRTYNITIGGNEFRIIRIASAFSRSYFELARLFNASTQQLRIISRPPDYFPDPFSTLAWFDPSKGVVEYNLIITMRNDSVMLQTLLHEAVHALSAERLPGASCPWFSEGLAEYLALNMSGRYFDYTSLVEGMEENAHCKGCNNSRTDYDRGYLFFANAGCSFPCLFSFWEGGGCDEVAATVQLCCPNSSSAFRTAWLFHVPDPSLQRLGDALQDCPPSELSGAVHRAVEAGDAEAVRSLCAGLSRLRELANTSSKLPFYEDALQTGDIEGNLQQLLHFDRFQSLRRVADSLRCARSYPDTPYEGALFLEENLPLWEKQELELNSTFEELAGFPSYLDRARPLFEECRLEELRSLLSSARQCATFREKWGPLAPLLNIFLRRCP